MTKSALVAAIIALVAGFAFSSCEDKAEELGVREWQTVEKKNPGEPNPGLTFTPIVDEEQVDSAEVISEVWDSVLNYSILAQISCVEDEYVIERQYKDLSVAYCNLDDHKTVSGKESGHVVAAFAWEDGNIANVWVEAPVLGSVKDVQLPYWKVSDINITNLRNYKESGDSLWTEVTALVNFTSVGIEPVKQASLTLKDSVLRVMVAEEDRVVDKLYDVYRDPVSDTQEQIQIVKIWIWKSGNETAEPATPIQLLPRTIEKIELGEQETTDLNSQFSTSSPALSKGGQMNASDVELNTHFTNLVKRVDVYTSVVRNAAGNVFHPEYKLTHYGVTYVDEDTTIVFPVLDWEVTEAGNVLSATTGSVANAEYRKVTNTVRTKYLEYTQNASESGKIYKVNEPEPQDEVTEGWDTEASWLRVNGNKVTAHGEWLRKHTLADDERITFDTTFVRNLSANTWEIYVDKKDNTTGANATNATTANKSKGVWSWTIVTNKVTENVTFADGSRQNVFTGTEYGNIALTYKGKKLAFNDYSYEYSEGANSVSLTSAGSNDQYEIFKQSTKVNAIAQGNQSISATSVGTIYVKKEEQKPDEPPFFPSEYGKFENAKFSATVNPYKANSWYIGCVMTFEKGVLALPIDQSGKPDWNHMTWWPGIKDSALNGAYYVERQGKWYPVIASDQSRGMEWSVCAAQGSYCLYILPYAGADTYGDWNYNDKNNRGQHTVLTNRFKMVNDAANGKVTLYYNNTNKGSWTYAK